MTAEKDEESLGEIRMNKYKALLFREWKVTKKFYFTKILLFLFFVALFAAVAFFVYSVNEFGEYTMENRCLLASASAIFLVLLPAVMVAEDNGLYKSDVNLGWIDFSRALPLTSYDKAFSKYLFKTIGILMGLMLSIFTTIGICAIMNCPIQISAIYAFIWLVAIILGIDLIRQIIILYNIDMKTIKLICDIGFILSIVWCFLPIDVSPSDEIKDIFHFIQDMYRGETLSEAESERLGKMFSEWFQDLFTISHLWGCIGFWLVILILIVGFRITVKVGNCET